ncbi:MAG TPA: hypothetical protein ENN30_00595 [Candidatus Woesearchaeota archaeon]|nr:hypothetical protein [Candidatus Woesearchaeota archaeon]
MVEYKVIKEKFIPVSEAKEILSKEEELEYEQKLALEHAKKFGKIKKENVEKIIEELNALENRKLKEEYIMKIIDLLPKDMEDLKTAVSGSPMAFKDEDLEPVLEILKKYVK